MKLLLGAKHRDGGFVTPFNRLPTVTNIDRWQDIERRFGAIADSFEDRARRNKRRRGGAIYSPFIQQIGAPAVVDPATLNLTGYWLDPYSGDPWVGTASLGTSSSHNLITASGLTAPTTGTPVNGHVPAAFSAAGTSGLMLGGGLFTDALFASTTYYYRILVKPTVALTHDATGAHYNPGIAGDTQGSSYIYGLVFDDSGFTAYQYDQNLGANVNVGPIAAATGAYYDVEVWYDGTNLHLAVNGIETTPVACDATYFAAHYNTSLQFLLGGVSWVNATYFTGDVLMALTATSIP